MKTIAELCTQIEEHTPEDRLFAFGRLSTKVVNSCLNYAENPEDAIQMFGVLLCAALVADDKISKGEFDLLSKSMSLTFGDKANMKDCRKLAKELMRDSDTYRHAADVLVKEYLSHWERRDREAIILCCITICGIDGVVSQQEEDWLNMLMEDM